MNVTLPTPAQEKEITDRNCIQRLVNKFIDPSDCELLKKRVYYSEYEADENIFSNKSSTRSVFILRIYQYLTSLSLIDESSPEEIFKIAAIAEYDMTIMYHENHVRDQKYGVSRAKPFTIQKKKSQKYALELRKNSLIQKYFYGEVLHKVKIANHFMHEVHDLIGMMLDKEFTTIKSFNNNSYPFKIIQTHIQELESYKPFLNTFENRNSSKSLKDFDLVNVEEFIETIYSSPKRRHWGFKQPEYLRLYFARCFLLNVIFYYVYTKLLISLYSNISTTETDSLISFARHFGLIQQIINDNSDFIPINDARPTPCKFKEDTFSDLREKNITLPVIYFLSKTNSSKGVLYDYLSGRDLNLDLHDNEIQKLILHQFLSRGAISKSMSFGTILAKFAGGILNIDKPATKCLNNMLTPAFENQYYAYYNSKKTEKKRH